MIPRRPFYFLRHGQTNWNLEGRYQGVADTPLNDTGLAQAGAAAAALGEVKIDWIIASPMIRALKTAAIVAEAVGAPLQIDRGLRERDFGSFDGRIIAEVKAEHGLPADQNSRSILPGDADPWDEILTRVPPVMGRWLTRLDGQSLLFVAHGGVFDALHLHLIGPRSGPESKHSSPYLVQPEGAGWCISELGSRG